MRDKTGTPRKAQKREDSHSLKTTLLHNIHFHRNNNKERKRSHKPFRVHIQALLGGVSDRIGSAVGFPEAVIQREHACAPPTPPPLHLTEPFIIIIIIIITTTTNTN